MDPTETLTDQVIEALAAYIVALYVDLGFTQLSIEEVGDVCEDLEEYHGIKVDEWDIWADIVQKHSTGPSSTGDVTLKTKGHAHKRGEAEGILPGAWLPTIQNTVGKK